MINLRLAILYIDL